MSIRLLLAGEGQNDIGDLAREPSYRNAPPSPGVLQALIEQLAPDHASVEIVGGVRWKDIHKFKAGNHRQAEQRNVLGLALKAREARVDAAVFSRDRDGDRKREEQIEAGLSEAGELFSDVRITGGIAVEKLEGWMLALQGQHRSEAHTRPENALDAETTVEMVAIVQEAHLAALPDDAQSLRQWIERVGTLLAAAEENSS